MSRAVLQMGIPLRTLADLGDVDWGYRVPSSVLCKYGPGDLPHVCGLSLRKEQMNEVCSGCR